MTFDYMKICSNGKKTLVFISLTEYQGASDYANRNHHSSVTGSTDIVMQIL